MNNKIKKGAKPMMAKGGSKVKLRKHQTYGQTTGADVAIAKEEGRTARQQARQEGRTARAQIRANDPRSFIEKMFGRRRQPPITPNGRVEAQPIAPTPRTGTPPRSVEEINSNPRRIESIDGIKGDNTDNMTFPKMNRKKGGSVTKAKKFAALAPPYNKATAADRIAGAKKSKSSKKK